MLKPLQGLLDGKLVISIVAGAEIATLSALLGTDRIVRVMPNTPALVQTGAHGLFANEEVGAEDRELASQVLASTGLTIWVNSEAQIDAVTAVSGSGPAYFFYMMESMIRAGKNLGLDEKVATALTLQTALGQRKWRSPVLIHQQSCVRMSHLRMVQLKRHWKYLIARKFLRIFRQRLLLRKT